MHWPFTPRRSLRERVGAGATVEDLLAAAEVQQKRTVRSSPRSASTPAPSANGAPEPGTYVDVLTLQLWTLATAAGKPTLSLLSGTGDLGIEDADLREDLKSQAHMYKRIGHKLLLNAEKKYAVLWSDNGARRVALPVELLRRHGRSAARELVEPITKSTYLHTPGTLVPLSLRDPTLDVNPNHVAAAGVLRQVRPPSVLFHEPATNLLFYLRAADNRLVDLRDPDSEGELIAQGVVLPTASVAAAMAPARVIVQRGGKKGCL